MRGQHLTQEGSTERSGASGDQNRRIVQAAGQFISLDVSMLLPDQVNHFTRGGEGLERTSPVREFLELRHSIPAGIPFMLVVGLIDRPETTVVTERDPTVFVILELAGEKA